MMVVLTLLQLAVMLITLLTCMWQCYTNSSLRHQISTLKQTSPPISLPPIPPIQPRLSSVELLGPALQLPASESGIVDISKKTKETNPVPTLSPDAKTVAVRRSSSASDLVSRSTRIQARLSQSDYLAVRRGGDGGRGEEEDMWLVSSSMSDLDSFVVSYQ